MAIQGYDQSIQNQEQTVNMAQALKEQWAAARMDWHDELGVICRASWRFSIWQGDTGQPRRSKESS